MAHLKRFRPSGLWRALFRAKLARARMPLWRVVVESKLDRSRRRWPSGYVAAVAAIFVWAHTVEEAEALACLAVEGEGMSPLTADALKCAPAAPPSRTPGVVGRSELGFLAAGGDERDSAGSKRAST